MDMMLGGKMDLSIVSDEQEEVKIHVSGQNEQEI
jgi:hypothetical protein